MKRLIIYFVGLCLILVNQNFIDLKCHYKVFINLYFRYQSKLIKYLRIYSIKRL